MRKTQGIKAQDILALLKLCISTGPTPAYRGFAKDLAFSVSEVHASLERCRAIGLISENKQIVNKSALLEFLIHGIRYVFPAQPRTKQLGIPTGASIELFPVVHDAGMVWPSAEGSKSGLSISPLYPSAPNAALKNPELHQLLALVDCLRLPYNEHRGWAEEQLTLKLAGSAALNSRPSASEIARAPMTSRMEMDEIERAIAVGLQSVVKQGYRSTTLDHVAREACVAPDKLRQAFEQNEALHAEIVRRLIQTPGQVVGQLSFISQDFTTRHIQQFVRSFFAMSRNDISFFRGQLWIMAESPVTPDFMRQFFSPMMNALGACLQKQAGTSGDQDRICRGVTLMSLLHQHVMLKWVYSKWIDPVISEEAIVQAYEQFVEEKILPALIE